MSAQPPVPRPPFVTPKPVLFTPPKKRRKVQGFIDESGDRNTSENRQSDFFSMSAVLVAEEFENDLRVAMAGIKSHFGASGAFHWKDHCRKRYANRRDLVARTLARVPGVQVIHVVLDKTRLRPESYIRHDQQVGYHWVAKFLMERIAWAADNWADGRRSAIVRFGVVGGVDHDETRQVLEYVEQASRRKGASAIHRSIPWGSIIRPAEWNDTVRLDGLQAADAYSGILTAAVKDDCAKWLVMTRHQLFRRAGVIEGYGLKTLPSTGHLAERTWWPDLMH